MKLPALRRGLLGACLLVAAALPRGLAAGPAASPGLALSPCKLPGLELEARCDLRLYTTTPAVDDVDDVRAALGYDRINVNGGSYGTLAALHYMRRHPEHVRTAVLEGLVTPDSRLPLYFAHGAQVALD